MGGGGGIKATFTIIKEKNLFGSLESVSGVGSEIKRTEKLVVELSKLLKDKEIKTIIDIPCGDFNWMKNVVLSNINYIGGDIVDEIVDENIKKYKTENINFKVINLVANPLPVGDIIIVRDCFVHLSYKHIFKSIKNIKKSRCKYLLTTTFPEHHNNHDIKTGGWRALNLQDKPFCFPSPEQIIIENCTEGNGEWLDKSMGLWEIKSLFLR